MSVENKGLVNLTISLKTPEGEINPNFSGAAAGETFPQAIASAVTMIDGMVRASQRYSAPYRLTHERFEIRNGHIIKWEEIGNVIAPTKVETTVS